MRDGRCVVGSFSSRKLLALLVSRFVDLRFASANLASAPADLADLKDLVIRSATVLFGLRSGCPLQGVIRPLALRQRTLMNCEL